MFLCCCSQSIKGFVVVLEFGLQCLMHFWEKIDTVGQISVPQDIVFVFLQTFPLRLSV